jgi:hypothetical protein
VLVAKAVHVLRASATTEPVSQQNLGLFTNEGIAYYLSVIGVILKATSNVPRHCFLASPCSALMSISSERSLKISKH